MVSFDDIIKNNRYEIEDGLYIFIRPVDIKAPVTINETLRECPYCGSPAIGYSDIVYAGGWAWTVYRCGVMVAWLDFCEIAGIGAPTKTCKEASVTLSSIDEDVI